MREQQGDARPKIASTLPSLNGYDTILLGSPIWNVQEPMIMRTFIEALDWTGKAVHRPGHEERLATAPAAVVTELGVSATEMARREKTTASRNLEMPTQRQEAGRTVRVTAPAGPVRRQPGSGRCHLARALELTQNLGDLPLSRSNGRAAAGA